MCHWGMNKQEAKPVQAAKGLSLESAEMEAGQFPLSLLLSDPRDPQHDSCIIEKWLPWPFPFWAPLVSPVLTLFAFKWCFLNLGPVIGCGYTWVQVQAHNIVFMQDLKANGQPKQLCSREHEALKKDGPVINGVTWYWKPWTWVSVSKKSIGWERQGFRIRPPGISKSNCWSASQYPSSPSSLVTRHSLFS